MLHRLAQRLLGLTFAFSLLAPGSLPGPLLAQPPPPSPEEDPPFDPYPGQALEEDPGSTLDPTYLDYLPTLGEPRSAGWRET